MTSRYGCRGRSAAGTAPRLSASKRPPAAPAVCEATRSIDGQPMLKTVPGPRPCAKTRRAAQLGGREVQVDELGDGVAHALVDRARHLAALGVRHGMFM